MGRLRLLAAIGVAACAGVAVAASGGTSHPTAATSSGWWWTQDYASDRVSIRWTGGAYWSIGCAGIGPHRYYDVVAAAVGPGGQRIGSQGPGVTGSTWKWQHFRCVRVLKNGWTTFEVYVLGGYGFKIAPPRGTRFVVTQPIVFS